jgi:hypothetical protein
LFKNKVGEDLFLLQIILRFFQSDILGFEVGKSMGETLLLYVLIGPLVWLLGVLWGAVPEIVDCAICFV